MELPVASNSYKHLVKKCEQIPGVKVISDRNGWISVSQDKKELAYRIVEGRDEFFSRKIRTISGKHTQVKMKDNAVWATLNKLLKAAIK